MAYIDFSSTQAVKRLKLLAEKPFDLTGDNALSEERIQKYKASSCGLDLLFATQRLDDQVLETLQSLSDELGLIDQFLAMKRGEIMNKIEGYESENRQVQHTACRDIFTTENDVSESVSLAKQQLARLKQFLDDLDSGKIVNRHGESFTTIVQIGIGGSDLGPRALYHALRRYRIKGRRAFFVANVDPDDAADVLQGLDLSRTLFNIVSKSGTTLETLTNELLIRHSLEKAGLDPKYHLLAVTGEGSQMDDPGKYLATFHMYDYIGGRFSVTSMVGAVTLGFVLGYDNFIEVLRGAHAMDKEAENRNIIQNLPLLTALTGIWNHNMLGHESLAILPYSQALLRFPAHLQQCDMESNGKSTTRQGSKVSWKTGPIIWGEPGTNGQHAFFQLLHQGTVIVPVEFIGFRRSQYEVDLEVGGTSSQQKLVANMLAQAIAFARGADNNNPNKRFAGNRPSSILLADQLTPFTMGALLALYENRIVFQGFCWNINSFDQEGVQLGKILAGKLLQELAAENRNRDGSVRKILNENSTEKQILIAAKCMNSGS